MEIVLLVTTLVSVATAVAALIAVRRVQHAERQRSDARIAALDAAANAPGPEAGSAPRVDAGHVPLDRPVRPAVRLAVSDDAHPASPEDFFRTVRRGEATTARMPAVAAGVLIVLLGTAMLLLRTTADHEPAAGVREASRTATLELVSLDHSREASSLTIAGVVRNPLAGRKMEGLTAVVSLLDPNGGLVSVKDVPLDYRALGPGEEAPFSVSVPNPGSIARYRVSFRAGTDLVPHLDRRSGETLASTLR